MLRNERNHKSQPASLRGSTKVSFRTLIIAGLLAGVTAFILFFLFHSTPQETANPDKKVGAGQDNPQALVLSKTAPDESLGSVIQSIRLHPMQPTTQDTLRAEVILLSTDPDPLSYRYEWKVNDRTIPYASSETLELSSFSKQDLLSVTVTPYNEGGAGFPVDSPIVAIHPIAPSLELQVPRQKLQGGAVEWQLISVHPDSDKVTFSLADPFVSGMTIDNQTGKVRWIIQPGQKGVIRFGASVEDGDKTVKVTKEFETVIE